MKDDQLSNQPSSFQEDAQLSKKLSDSLKSLSAATQSAYELAPIAVILLFLLAIPIVFLTTISSGLMKATAVILVLVVSLGIFIARNKFGEALLSIIGGLIAVLRVDWSIGLYIAFWSAWLGFSLLSLLISSLRLAAINQEIVRQAAVFIGSPRSDISEYERKIQSAMKESQTPHFKPIERAELARFFIFRKFSIDLLPKLIKATDKMSSVSKVDTLTVASCVADVALSIENSEIALTTNLICDPIFLAIRGTRATPDEFFQAFQNSRRFLIGDYFDLGVFLKELTNLLDMGLTASEISEELAKISGSKDNVKY